MNLRNRLVLFVITGLLLAAGSLFVAGRALAQGITFEGLTPAQLETVVKDFSSNFAFTTVAPASSLGTVFGFELGVIGGLTTTPGVEDLVKASDPTSDFSGIPHVAVIGALSVPFGLTAEINYFPSIDLSDVKLSSFGFGVKWTMTDSILSLPLDLALRASYVTNSLGWKQTLTVNSVDTETGVDFDSSQFGLTALVSKSFVVVEPYAGLGYVMADGTLKVNATGTNDLFGGSLTNQTEATASPSGLQYFVGAHLNLLFLKLGVEYNHVIDADRITGKLAFGF